MLSHSLRLAIFSALLAYGGTLSAAISGETPMELMDEARLCKSALAATLSDWSTFGSDRLAVEEARKRGLTADACRTAVQANVKPAEKAAKAETSELNTQGEVTQTAAKAAALSLSSYENRMAASRAIGPFSLIGNFGGIKVESDVPFLKTFADQILQSAGYAFADFFGDGTYSLVVHTFEYDRTPRTQDRLGRIVFLRLSGGTWRDETSKLLDDARGCLHARKAIVSDFNGDSRPDVFFGCTGMDSDPFPGERSLLLLSDASGKYHKSFLGWVGKNKRMFTHGSSAADVNGDSYADIVVTDNPPKWDHGGIGVLLNNKDGTFTFKSDIFKKFDYQRSAYSAELIKLDGRPCYDLFLSGHGDEKTDIPPQLLQNDCKGHFSPGKVFPVVQGYGLALDAIYGNGFFYVLRTTDLHSDFYQSSIVQKVKYPELSPTRIIYSHNGLYKNDTRWIDWIGFYEGSVISLNKDFELNVPRETTAISD